MSMNSLLKFSLNYGNDISYCGYANVCDCTVAEIKIVSNGNSMVIRPRDYYPGTQHIVLSSR